MESLKKGFFLIIGLAIVVWSFYFVLNKPAPAKYQKQTDNQQLTTNNSVLKVGSSTIQIEVADTEAKRELGLSGREALATGSGMLFIFDTPSKYGFWMKDMNFPLDIVWIGENWEIISVERNVSPESYPQIFTPEKAIRYALELNAGDARNLGIDTGVILSFGD